MVKMEEKNMPRKGENIYKRKDGRWEARYIYSFKEDGSPRYRSIYAADYLTVKKSKMMQGEKWIHVFFKVSV